MFYKTISLLTLLLETDKYIQTSSNQQQMISMIICWFGILGMFQRRDFPTVPIQNIQTKPASSIIK